MLARLGDCYIERRIGNLQENRKTAVDFLSKAVGLLTRETDPWRAANLRLARAQADSDADGVAGANQALNTVSSTLKTVTVEHPLWAEFCWQAARLWIHKVGGAGSMLLRLAPTCADLRRRPYCSRVSRLFVFGPLRPHAAEHSRCHPPSLAFQSR